MFIYKQLHSKPPLFADLQEEPHSKIKDIFRFRGSDITYHINECLIILSWYYPNIFDERGMTNLKILADRNILDDDFYRESNIAKIEISYRDSENDFNTIDSWRINDNYFGYKKISNILKENPSATMGVSQHLGKFLSRDL